MCPSGHYGYRLSRDWSRGTRACWRLLNPSTADHHDDDPTIRRLIGFSKRLGHGELVVVNLFAFRTPHPEELAGLHSHAVGPMNDHHVLLEALAADQVIVAWGTGGTLQGRDREVLELLAPLDMHCLSRTKHGHPGHPLYLRSDSELIGFG